jgi:hypothetical protein
MYVIYFCKYVYVYCIFWLTCRKVSSPDTLFNKCIGKKLPSNNLLQHLLLSLIKQMCNSTKTKPRYYMCDAAAPVGVGGPQKRQLHAGPGMQVPRLPPKPVQCFMQTLGTHLSPSERTVELHFPSEVSMPLSTDAVATSSVQMSAKMG